MAEFFTSVDITPYIIVDGLGWNMDKLLAFVIEIDEEAADLEFTKALRDELNEIISREEDNGQV